MNNYVTFALFQSMDYVVIVLFSNKCILTSFNNFQETFALFKTNGGRVLKIYSCVTYRCVTGREFIS